MKIIYVACATLAFATSAVAATPANTLAKDEAVLSLTGLDLSSAEGQQRLAIRIDQAARAVCGQGLSSVHLSTERKAQDCRAAVLADVRSQIETRLAATGDNRPVKLAALR